MTYIRRAEAVETTEPVSGPEWTRSTLGRMLAAWSRAAKQTKLSPSVRLVAWCLERYAKMDRSATDYFDHGRLQVNPSAETLAAEIGSDRRAVQRALKMMEAAGLIRRHVTRGGRQHTNFYEILPQKPTTDDLANSGQGTAVSAGERAVGDVEKQRSGTSRNSGRGTARIPLQRGIENARGSARGAAPDGAGAPRRRAGVKSRDGRPDVSTQEGYLRYIQSLPPPEEDGDDVPQPSRTREPADEYDDYVASLGPDDERRDRYVWLKSQITDLSPAKGLALIERNGRGLSSGEKSFLCRHAKKGRQ